MVKKTLLKVKAKRGAINLKPAVICCCLFTVLCVCMFPGTASVALAGLLAAQKAVGKPITEHQVLFLGAGEVS